jgi:hypothetical protein
MYSNMVLLQRHVKGDMLHHQVREWLAVTSRFWKSADITSGRVHLDVWRIDEGRLLQSTG